MDVGFRGLREAEEKIIEKFRLKITDAWRIYFCVDYAMRASAEIDGSDSESLVHGHDEIAGAEDALFVAERFKDGFAQCDANVFDGVVLIDVKIAASIDSEIERAVAGE